MKENKIEKQLERIHINVDLVKLLEKESYLQGKTKGEMFNHILQEHLVKRDNRLSNHIARSNEDLLIMLLTEPDKKYSNIKEIYEEQKVVSRTKSSVIKEHRDRKKTHQKNFWKEMLESVNIEEWKLIKTTEEGKDKLKEIYTILTKYKEFLDE